MRVLCVIVEFIIELCPFVEYNIIKPYQYYIISHLAPVRRRSAARILRAAHNNTRTVFLSDAAPVQCTQLHAFGRCAQEKKNIGTKREILGE